MIISEKQIFQLYDIARMCGQILLSLDRSPDKINEIGELLEMIRNQQSDKLKVIE